MKKLKVFVTILICFVSVFLLTACGGSSYVDYDYSTSGYQLTYEKVLEVQSNGSKYINKTFKLRGKLRSNTSTYHYLYSIDPNLGCCEWSMEVKLGDDTLSYPSSTTKNYIVTGKYKSTKVNGITSYYLEISDIS